jgi:hypothetical protein
MLGVRFRDLTSRRARARKDPFVFSDAFQYGGPLYAHMVWTWRFVFGPAVAFAFAGFVLLMIETKDAVLIVPAVLAIALVPTYYLISRPLLGAD